jgi:para-nitrobenzyl esterase
VDAVVETNRGQLRGHTRHHDFAFLGVPYAEAPFGPNRFQAPVPVAGWTGVRDALSFAPTAPQPGRQFTLIPEPIIDGGGGEAPACLSLNVWTPSLDRGAALPVFVFIHGGGFVAGSPSGPWYDGDAFTRDGVIVVSIGYRLGSEGFVSLDGAPENRAVLDCLAALEWVGDNIAAFGGDPARVTVGGQSAGGGLATIVGTHPRGAQLVRGVIAMSGTAMRLGGRARAERTRDAIAQAAGLSMSVDAFSALSPAKLVEIQDAARLNRSNSMAPTIDGEVIPTSLPDAIAAGVGSHVRVLAGATTEEGVAGARNAKVKKDALERFLEELGLDKARRKRFRALYPDANNGALRGHAATDANFRIGPVRMAEARAASGAAPTFLYETAWRSPQYGAVHCVDVPFAFDCLSDEHVAAVCGAAPPQSMADAIHGAFVRFITDGDPGWPAYDPSADRATMIFDEASRVASDPHRDLRDLWP